MAKRQLDKRIKDLLERAKSSSKDSAELERRGEELAVAEGKAIFKAIFKLIIAYLRYLK